MNSAKSVSTWPAVPVCREELRELESLRVEFEQVPAEAFLDGPPEGGDLAASTDHPPGPHRAPGTARLVGGRRRIAGPGRARRRLARRPQGRQAARRLSPSPPGSTQVAASNPTNGVHMTVVITPAKGWVRLDGAFTGVPAHARCYLMVVDRAGHRVIAGSWLAPSTSPPGGERVSGSALVPPADVTAVQVVTFSGRVLDTAQV